MRDQSATRCGGSRFGLFAVVMLLATNIHAGEACTIDRAVLSAPFGHPSSAPRKEVSAAWRVFYRATRSCPAGPADPHDREAIFRFVDQVLSLDYDKLCEIWLRNIPESNRSGDGCFPEEQQKDVAAYLARIVDSDRDQEHARIVLRHGDAKGIAKLGHAARHQVMTAATTPTDPVDRRYPQPEAIRALGFWIDATNHEFSATEKRELTAILLELLQAAKTAKSYGASMFTTEAIIEALAHTRDAYVRLRLRQWSQEYTRIHGPGQHLSELALAASRGKPQSKTK